MAMATRIAVFLITAHILLFWAGLQGFRPYQSGVNPHEQYVQSLSGDNFESNVTIGSGSGVVNTDQPVSYQSLTGLDYLRGILFSPYSLFSDSSLPSMLQLLFKSILGILEILMILYAVRGVVF